MTHPLTEKAMVVNLRIGAWVGQRLDRDATAKVTENAGAASDAARVNKHLIPKESLAAIVASQSAVRNHFYANSLPWRDNGDRLITRALYTKFIEAHEALVAKSNEEVEKFLADGYPSAIEKAEFRMGTMFDRSDYPHPSELRGKFYVSLDIDALTTSNDFRVAIDQAHVDRVKEAMEANMANRIQTATADVWRRMAEVVVRFEERMSKPDVVFRDSLISNITEMLDLVPGLNIVDDPAIEQVRAAIAKALGGIEAKEIRKDPALRQELAGEAGKIMETMSGFMRAFGAGNV